MTTVTRRGLMAGTVTLPGLSSSALPVDERAFAAIARHRKAHAAHAELFKELNGSNQDPPAVLTRAAGEAEAAALNALLGTTPTTLAGAVAMCRYIADCQSPGAPGPGAIFWDGDEHKAIAFMQRLADCMAKYA
jgi:hypothetical protein